MSSAREPCKHCCVETYGMADGPNMWACQGCGLRFYPACRECVDVGHRNIEHPHSDQPAAVQKLVAMMTKQLSETDKDRSRQGLPLRGSYAFRFPDGLVRAVLSSFQGDK